MKILHFEDNPGDIAVVRDLLMRTWPDCSVTPVAAPEGLRPALKAGAYDLVLADFNVLGFDGHAALRVVRELAPATPVIFVSGTIGEETAFDLIREGACDYVFKDRLDRLRMVIPRTLRERDERERREHAEAHLRDTEERFRSMFLTMVEGVLLLDGDGRIISANASTERILGRSVTELLGRSFAAEWNAIREDLSPYSVNESPPEVARRTGKLQPGAVMGIYQPRGALVWATVHAQPLRRSEKKRHPGLVVTLHDITEKKSLEEQLFRAQRLESLGLLAAGIAHDLNNVLAPVLMGVPLLRERQRDARDQVLLNTLEKSAVRGADLVRQILTIARGDAERRGPVQCKHLLRELVMLLEATLPKTIRIECDQSPDPWPAIGSPTRLHQVLLNLCVNARDAMASDGGTLRIVLRNHRVDLRSALALQTIPPGPYLEIEVSDTGRGIPPEILGRIWDPFFTTKSKEKGTGLGLSTVRGIVENHHGHVDVRSELGSGTTFRILLPATAESSEAPGKGSVSPFSPFRGHGELILIVDDEPEIRLVTTTVLTEHGYRVIAATDGMQAYSLLLRRSDEIKVLITDLSMPELDGSALAQMARRQFPEIRILVITGRGSAMNVDAEYEHHSDAFLPKPFTPRALLDCVHRVMTENRTKR
ncbi:MAG: response regulator [Opitutaceae bacterium]|nr:response regulator [Opitutaceae bacterium]